MFTLGLTTMVLLCELLLESRLLAVLLGIYVRQGTFDYCENHLE